MKINISNVAKVEQAIGAAEGTATKRLLEYSRIVDAAEIAEYRFEMLRIPKRAWKGARVGIIPPDLPNAYKSAAHGTYASLERGPRDWFLTSVRRSYCGRTAYGSGWGVQVELTEAMHAEIPRVW